VPLDAPAFMAASTVPLLEAFHGLLAHRP
jgi:hypothetical protein